MIELYVRGNPTGPIRAVKADAASITELTRLRAAQTQHADFVRDVAWLGAIPVGMLAQSLRSRYM